MSNYTFNQGLRELLDKRFIAPKDGVSFWTKNPALFFKGDRVMFIKEYRRRARAGEDQERRENLEAGGQQRLTE